MRQPASLFQLLGNITDEGTFDSGNTRGGGIVKRFGHFTMPPSFGTFQVNQFGCSDCAPAAGSRSAAIALPSVLFFLHDAGKYVNKTH